MTKNAPQNLPATPAAEPEKPLTLAELATDRPDITGDTILRELADMVDQLLPELVRAKGRTGRLTKPEKDYKEARQAVLTLIKEYQGDLQTLLERFNEVLDVVASANRQIDAQNVLIDQQSGQIKAAHNETDRAKQDMAAVVMLVNLFTRLTRYELARFMTRGSFNYYFEFGITGRDGIHLGVDYSPTARAATLSVIGARLSEYKFTIMVDPQGKIDSAAVLSILGYLGHPRVDPKILELDRVTTFPKEVHRTLHPSVASVEAQQLGRGRRSTINALGNTVLNASDAAYVSPSPSIERYQRLTQGSAKTGLDEGGQYVIGITATPPLEHGSDAFGRETIEEGYPNS